MEPPLKIDPIPKERIHQLGDFALNTPLKDLQNGARPPRPEDLHAAGKPAVTKPIHARNAAEFAAEILRQQPPPPKKKATKAEVRERLATLSQALIDGLAMPQIVAAAKRQWNIGKRMVQLYVQRIRKLWADEAQRCDYLAHLWQAKLQREAMVQKALHRLERVEKHGEYASILRCCTKLLSDRDQVMRELAEHRRVTSRDASPSSPQSQDARGGLFTMPRYDYLERCMSFEQMLREDLEYEYDKKYHPEKYPELRPGNTCVRPQPDVAPGAEPNEPEA